MKWIGAALIVCGCGCVGFYMAALHIREQQLLKKLITILDYMYCDLQFKLTPLPDLCRNASGITSGILKQILLEFSACLDNQVCPNVNACMCATLAKFPSIPSKIKECLQNLGVTMGRFDLEGQLQSIDSVRKECIKLMKAMESGQENRLRNYQTLGICAGAALVILFI